MELGASGHGASPVAVSADTTDASYLQCLRRQDEAAFTRLVDTHQKIVLGLGQSMGLRGADLDDAAAEVFAGVYRSLPRFEGRSAIGTWVYQIACRTFWKLRERRDAHKTTELNDDRIAAGQQSPDEAAEISEEQQLLWQAVSSLEPKQATAVELHYRRGFSVDEVARIMSCPEGTVKTLLFRAREQLRQRLQRKLGRTQSVES